MTTTSTRWTANDMPDQTGRFAIITGASSGLGYATTRALAAKGARVLMAVRSQARGEQALRALRAEQPAAQLELRLLDLADLDSVRSFAAAVRAEPVSIDLLINNAGIMMPRRALSPQGNESQFATNHLGHFALTGLLLEAMRADGRARVVTVSSTLHKRGRIQFDDLTGAQRYSRIGFYAQSKFANVLFALELDRRLRGAGRPIASVLAHPGYAATNLQSTGPTGLLRWAMRLGNPLFAQSAEHGARCQLYAAVDPSVAGGEFIGPDGLGENRGYPARVQPVRSARDEQTARRLWSVSEKLTGVSYALAAGL